MNRLLSSYRLGDTDDLDFNGARIPWAARAISAISDGPRPTATIAAAQSAWAKQRRVRRMQADRHYSQVPADLKTRLHHSPPRNRIYLSAS
jgi:hypothetical protein